jgi:hypothetical protein
MKQFAAITTGFIFSFLVVSCQSKGISGITPALTQTPGVSLPDPASDYLEGYSSIPEGKASFIEVREKRINLGDCVGPQLAPPIYHYHYEGGALSLDSTKNMRKINPLGIIGFRSTTRYENPNDSWCTRNCGDDGTDLYLYYSLPYVLNAFGFPNVIVHSIRSDGVVIAEIEGAVFSIKPGQSWERVEDNTYPADPADRTICPRVVSIFTLTNNGLVSGENITWF